MANLDPIVRAMGQKTNTQHSRAHRELGRVRLPIERYLCCSGVVVTITARSDGVRAHLNRRWLYTDPSADHTWPVREQLRAQRPAHIEPDLGRSRQDQMKAVE